MELAARDAEALAHPLRDLEQTGSVLSLGVAGGIVGTTGIAAQTDDAELVDLIAAVERSRNSFDAI